MTFIDRSGSLRFNHTYIIFTLSIGLFLVAFSVAWSFIGPRALPWWVDGGIWLKYANGLLGVTWPLWNEKSLNYPPLFPTILAILVYLTGDPVFSIKFLAVLTFSLRPLIVFLSSILLFKRLSVSVSAGIIMMMLPIHVEMLGWGGYPNLLSSSLLMISITLLITWLKGNSRKLLLLLFITSALIGIGHNLTFLVYSTTLLILLAASLTLRRRTAALKILSVFSFTLGIYAFYIFAFLWPLDYLIYNEAAHYYLKVSLASGFLTWIFKSEFFFLTLYALMAVTIVSALLTRKMLTEISVLTAWLMAPLLLINLHELGIALDYQRVFIFFVEPFVILAMGSQEFFFSMSGESKNPSLAKLKEWALRIFGYILINFITRIFRLLLVIALVFAIFSSIAYGYSTFKSVDEWYNFRDNYGDSEKLEIIKLIKDNIPNDSVIVAEEEIARWIEGYSSRRVLMYTHPMYLFVKGEHERAYLARTILLSSYCLTNDIVTIYEPYDPRENISSRIALKTRGALEEVFFLESNSSYVEGYHNLEAFREYISNAESVKITEGEDNIIVSYIFKNFLIEKTLSIDPKNNKASLSFKIESLNSSVKLDRIIIELRKWPTRTIWEVKVKGNGTLLATTDIGEFTIETNSITAFPFTFILHPHHKAIIEVSVSEKQQTGREVKLINSRDLMREFNVNYIVIPRIQDSKFERYITLKPVTRPEYMHLLHNPNYKIVYQNSRAIVLELHES